jgi:DNA-binding MarR family transcriptional regulator
MAKQKNPAPNPTETRRTIGALLRLPYAALSERVYAGMATRGYPEIRPAHSSVFRHIEPGGSRITDLAERAGITKQSMAYLVDGLVGDGYAEVLPDAADGRAKLVRLTRRGRAALAALMALSAETEAEFARLIGATEMADLRRLLEALCDRLAPPGGG